MPFQLIYTGKTACSLLSVEFPNGFCLSYIPKHWSNKYETINLLGNVVDQYFCQVREELGLQNDQKALILWDTFKAKSTDKVIKELERLKIVQVMMLKKFDLPASTPSFNDRCISEENGKEML